ncbi:hypothetical protein [Streptomyces sp. NPDC046985]|uniref:hypothetical protein n=1 Tax=Streptomyces sp. NPDC046985 TaxID=3155377 RepID=UPI0033E20A3A
MDSIPRAVQTFTGRLPLNPPRAARAAALAAPQGRRAPGADTGAPLMRPWGSGAGGRPPGAQGAVGAMGGEPVPAVPVPRGITIL